MMPHPSKPRELSPREREVAALADLPTREIAKKLGVAEKTVHAQIQHIRATLGIRDREEIAKRMKSEAAQE